MGTIPSQSSKETTVPDDEGSEDFKHAQELMDQLREQDEKAKEVAEHAKQAFTACKVAFEFLADEATPGEAKDKAMELAEHAGAAAEHLEQIVKDVELAVLAENLVSLGNAAEALKSASDGGAAAQAADSLFSAAGRLGSLLPPGPWKAYFEFLKGFEANHFFEHMQKALTKWQDDAMQGVEH
jgi:hypothetical protein